MSADDGWQLGRESWEFHRQFYRRTGRPAAWREYSAILWSIRKRQAEQLAPHHYRVTLADGSLVVVQGSGKRLSGVPSPGWTPPKPAAKPEPPPEPKPARSPTTLTLGGAAAAAAAKRLAAGLGVRNDRN